MFKQDKLCTNKILNANWHFSQLYLENKACGIAKPLTKIYITIFFRVQVTHLEIMHTIHQLLNFNTCGLVNPMAFVITVRGRALHGQPLPILHVHQLLPPQLRAVCEARADLFAHIVCLHACQG